MDIHLLANPVVGLEDREIAFVPTSEGPYMNGENNIVGNYEARTRIRDTDTIRHGYADTPFLKKVGYDTLGIR